MPKLFSLIVCTYMRPEALIRLLNSVKKQTHYPDEILIIDGSTNFATEEALKVHIFKNLSYFKVNEVNRGLTKQRNFGLKQLSKASKIVCFLDDDVILETDYFHHLILTYSKYPETIAVGGYITNEVHWEKVSVENESSKFYFDGWARHESSRFKIRRILGLQPDAAPGYLPSFAHGRSTSYLPPSNKTYPVEFFMGGVSSYKTSIFKKVTFSNYFEGYGLYEDLDFCLRASKLGPMYVNTAAKLEHHHEKGGRPDTYKFGKMVVRNSWYVWKVKYNNPSFKAICKYHATVILLMIIHFTNSFYGRNKMNSFKETLGRFVGWLSLFFNKPKGK